MRTITLIVAILILASPEIAGNAYAAKIGKKCGTLAGVTCDQGLWCDPLPGHCGSNERGECKKVPQGCPQASHPVCGCDGNAYSNDCERRSKMVGLKSNGACR